MEDTDKTKDIESFLEFMNFYRQFIQNFSHTAKPFNELKERKNVSRKRNINKPLMNSRTR